MNRRIKNNRDDIDYTLNNKCNVSFQSQYVYIEKKRYSIDEYKLNNKLQKSIRLGKKKLCCSKGHELIYVNGKKVKSYFRHKNTDDVGGNKMTIWHSEWEYNFPVTEEWFFKKNNDQIKDRRADAVVKNHNLVIEFQHSPITEDEVNNRKNDYKLHNQEVMWIIDGKNTIQVKKLNHSNRIYLEFTSECWKFESFRSYNCIYIDIENEIYKVNPNKVKSNMIDILPPKQKNEFINAIKNNINLWKKDVPLQCKLYIRQQGAGNGKTYGIIQMLEKDEFKHYKNYIMVTKQHSAKYVIYNEFNDQIRRKEINYLQIKDEPHTAKQYIIKYFNKKSNTNCQLIIATIDSLMYSIGNRNHGEYDKFEGLVNSIIDNHIDASSKGVIKFARINPKLNKETLLVIDEAQDLPINYAKAIIQIMRNRYVDTYIVGDKLQSISYDNNTFTYLSDNQFPNINVVKEEKSNIVRRFIHPKLINFINAMIPFDKYDLPKIRPYKQVNEGNMNPIQFIVGNTIFNNDPKEKINEEVEKIIEKISKETDEYKRVPEDFLIITPFTKQNPLIDALQLALNKYWKDKISLDKQYIKNVLKQHTYWKQNLNKNKYYRYAIFHKSELGTSINLSESENATRIVSCHSSKGDGRPVVFVIGFTENALKKFSGDIGNLIYDSLFHVALTRMKEKLYVRVENNGDDISTKIEEYSEGNKNFNLKPNIYVNSSINYNTISEHKLIHDKYKLFSDKIIQKSQLDTTLVDKENDDDDKKLIDMGHHSVRYASLVINLWLYILSKENKLKDKNDIKRQLMALLHSTEDATLITATLWKEYNKFLYDENYKCIPVYKISNNGRDYIYHYNTIVTFIENIKEKIKLFTSQKEQLIQLCPYESIILYYMSETCNGHKFADVNITELYNITDVYSKSINKTFDKHSACLCKKQFNKKQKIELTNKNIEDMDIYLQSHYEKIASIRNIYDIFCKKYPRVNWLMNHIVKYRGKTNSLKLWKKFKLIGYNDDTVVIAYIKPQFNEINYNEILIKSIFDTHLVSNAKTNNNRDRFDNKKIITVIFTPDRKKPYYIDWGNIIRSNEPLIIEVLKKFLVNKYIYYNKTLYRFYKYCRIECRLTHKIKNPLKICDKFQEMYDIEKKKLEDSNVIMPEYIMNFIKEMRFEVNYANKKDKRKILKKYDNNNFFVSKINEALYDFIDRYLGIQNNDYDDDDDYSSEDDIYNDDFGDCIEVVKTKLKPLNINNVKIKNKKKTKI